MADIGRRQCSISKCSLERPTPLTEVQGAHPARRARRAVLLVVTLVGEADAVHAHGFGQRFDLPLPLWLWLSGAGATLVITFAAAGLFVRERRADMGWPQIDLTRFAAVRWLARPAAVALLRWAAVALFVLTVVAGLIGNPSPYRNLIPTMVWIIWWVGCAVVGALIGPAWQLLNPLPTLFAAAESAWATATRGRSLSRKWPLPPWLGAWPGVVLFAVFAWGELVWAGKDVPALLASAVFGYAVITWAGMFAFGRDIWLQAGDAFAIAFGILARFAPLAYVSPGDRAACPRLTPGAVNRHLVLHPHGAGLLLESRVSWSMLVFVLTMLAMVTFDGFKEIPAMQRLDVAIHSLRPVAEALFALSEQGLDEAQIVATAMLVAFPAAFVAVFWVANVAARRLGGAAGAMMSSGEVARSFVLTLVPIAVAYQLSHYASLLFTSGQFLIPLASDPFGFGWNLFGTAGYKIDLALVSPYVFWYGAVAIIVIGHVIAVLLAHATALHLFGTHRDAVRSQLPMLALMVAYTTLSLWILAQPIVG